MEDKLKKIGLNVTDIQKIDHIESESVKIVDIVNLLIKTYNSGFNDGVKESVAYMECVQKGIAYE